MKPFDGVTAWVFGGSKGIGRATSLRLAESGAQLLILARGAEALDETAAAARARCRRDDQRIASQQLDVTDAAQVEQVVARQLRDFGTPQLVINCTGGAHPAEFGDIDADQFDRTLQLNLYACRHIAAALAPHLAAGAVLVNTASLAGLIGVYGYTDYCAAKFGLVGFSEALRAELKPRGIRVSVLCPPDTDTPGFAEENRSKPAATAAVSAGARLLSADDVAAALLRGLRRGQFLIIPGADGRLAALAQRLVPGLLRWYADRVVAKTLQA